MYFEEANTNPKPSTSGRRKPSHSVQLRKFQKMHVIMNDRSIARNRDRILAQAFLTPEEEAAIEAQDKLAREKNREFDLTAVAGQTQSSQELLDATVSPIIKFGNNKLTFVSPDDDLVYLRQFLQLVETQITETTTFEAPSCETGKMVKLDAFLMPVIEVEAPGREDALDEMEVDLPPIDEFETNDEPGSPEYRAESPDYGGPAVDWNLEEPDYISTVADYEESLKKPTTWQEYDNVDVEHLRSNAVLSISKTLRLHLEYTACEVGGSLNRVVTGCRTLPPDGELQGFSSKIKPCQYRKTNGKVKTTDALNGQIVLVPPCNARRIYEHLTNVAINHSLFVYNIREFVHNGRVIQTCYC